MTKVDIHNYPRRFERLRALVRAGGVSGSTRSRKRITQRNVELLIAFDEMRALDGVKLSTRVHNLAILLEFARVVDKDHPARDNPEAPLFTHLRSSEALHYGGICRVIRTLAKRAGLAHKKTNPHIFRHSRITILSKFWPERMIKAYVGWTPNSAQMRTYSHVTTREANALLLKQYGLAKDEKKTELQLKAQLCATCHANNGPEAKFCGRCGRRASLPSRPGRRALPER